MVWEVVAVDENIVEVSSTKAVQIFFEAVRHEMLERDWCWSEAKRHYCVLQVSVACLEHGVPFFPCCHSDLVVSLSEVEFCVLLYF